MFDTIIWTPALLFSDLQNRVAAAFPAAFPEHNPVFSGDWGSASTSRNQVFLKHRECLVFRICIYRCIACCYPKTAADGFRSASMPPGMQIRVNLLVRRVYRNLIPLTFVVCGRSVMIGSGKTQSYQCFNAASKRLYPNFFSKRMGSYDKRFFQMM